MTPQKFRHALEQCGFESCLPMIEAGLQDEVLLTPIESKYDLPIGATKQGGEPDLPPGYDWPKYSRRGVHGLCNTSKPMTFLAQLRCADLSPFAPSQFPRHGLLSFFVAIEQNEFVCDKNEQPVGYVLYSSDLAIEMPMRTPFPRGLYFGNRLPPCSLKIESSKSIGFEVLNDAIEQQFGYSQELSERIWDLYQQEIIPTGCHKLFGPPTMLELDVMEESRLLAKTGQLPGITVCNDWCLLLEFDPAELPTDILLDDGERLYFMIRRDDLAACRFNNTLVLHDALGRH